MTARPAGARIAVLSLIFILNKQDLSKAPSIAWHTRGFIYELGSFSEPYFYSILTAMKVQLWAIGKTNERYLEEGIGLYTKRLDHYLKFEWRVLPDVKKAGKLAPPQLKAKEAETVHKQLAQGDFLILLDEGGKPMSSEAFALFLEHKLQLSYRRLIFLIGGAYGFDESLYERADSKLSLSKMTFSHQMVRLFMAEQLYRAVTILNNEPYHNP